MHWVKVKSCPSRGFALTHLVEEQAQLPFRLADPLAEAVGSFPHEERQLLVAMATLVGERPCH
jgi:hypothetical protein